MERMAALGTQLGTPVGGAPHVTLIGNVGDSSDRKSVSEKLERLRGTGPVLLRFSSVAAGVFPAGHELAGQSPWSQTAAAIVETCPELERLKRLSDQAFSSPPASADAGVSVEWAPPLGLPHLSLAYGSDPRVSSELEAPVQCEADAVAIFDCTPASLAAIPGWAEVARVSLRD